MSSDLLSVDAVATRLGLHPKTVLRMIREARISAARVGRSWRIPASELGRLLGPTRAAGARLGPVSLTIEISDADRTLHDRIVALLSGALGARAGQGAFTAQYEPEAARLRILLVAPAPDARALLGMIEAAAGAQP